MEQNWDRARAPQTVRVLLPVQNQDVSIHEIGYGHKSLARELVETVLITLLIFMVVQSVVQNRRVDGSSMEPTLHHEEYLLIDKFSYLRWDNVPFASLLPNAAPSARPQYVLGSGPQRGDIIVLHPPTDLRDYIKRIIALEHETVEIKANDGVYVEGVRLNEPYIKEIPQYNYGPLEVPEGHVFVLGDNRNNSSDSHAWGPLKMDDIVGRAWISYWPQEMWGLVPQPSYAEIDQLRR